MIESPKAREALLRKPYPCDHLVQIYNDDEVLVRAIAHLIGSGLELGEAAIVMSTPEHLGALNKRLVSTGVKIPSTTEPRVFVAFDAHRCLSQIHDRFSGRKIDARPHWSSRRCGTKCWPSTTRVCCARIASIQSSRRYDTEASSRSPAAIRIHSA